jgi:hypothetical protein
MQKRELLGAINRAATPGEMQPGMVLVGASFMKPEGKLGKNNKPRPLDRGRG